jgi:hypothetical protein
MPGHDRDMSHHQVPLVSGGGVAGDLPGQVRPVGALFSWIRQIQQFSENGSRIKHREFLARAEKTAL